MSSPIRDDAHRRVVARVDTDAALVRALQENGRATVQELARRLDSPREVVSRELRELSESGRLRVFAAVDPRVAGHRVLVHAMVAVDGPAMPIARRIAELPEAVFVSVTGGARAIVFESRHRSDRDCHATLARIRGFAGVLGITVNTHVEALRGHFFAERFVDIALDDIDRSLVALLQEDGRRSFRALADLVHLAPSSVRARVHRMMDAGTFRVTALTSDRLYRHGIVIGIGIMVTGDAAPIRRYVLESPVVEYATGAYGTYDLIVMIVGSDSARVLQVLEELRALPEVGSLETWTHYQIIKEEYPRAA